MKKALYVVTLLVAAVCMAEEKAATPKEGQHPHYGNHPLPKEILEKFDKDGDGKLNEAEMKAFREARQAELLKKYDKDGDGKLNDEEKKAMREDFIKEHPRAAEAIKDHREAKKDKENK